MGIVVSLKMSFDNAFFFVIFPLLVLSDVLIHNEQEFLSFYLSSRNSSFENQHIYILNNINLLQHQDKINLPIGCSQNGDEWLIKPFAGYLHGNGHTLSNLNITGNKICGASLFADFQGDVIISDLVFDYTCTFTGETTAGVISQTQGVNSLIFQNITTYATYQYEVCAAGIAGVIRARNVTITNCSNNGFYKQTSTQGDLIVGGICGSIETKNLLMSHCTSHSIFTIQINS